MSELIYDKHKNFTEILDEAVKSHIDYHLEKNLDYYWEKELKPSYIKSINKRVRCEVFQNASIPEEIKIRVKFMKADVEE